MNSAPFVQRKEWSLLALQVWLNTQNNLENHGLGTMNITASASPSYIDDKFGKSLSMGSYYLKIPWEYDSEELTIALWVKPKTPRAYSDIFAIGEYDNRFEVNTTTGYYWFSDSKNLIGGNTHLTGLSNDTWYHIAFIMDETSGKFYVNGSLIVEKTKVNNLSDIWGSNKSITIGSRIKGTNLYNSYMSDIRIYDNAISPREIKELAKGMICHYPLNDPYPTASINKYSGDFFEGKANNGGGDDITCTKLENERGYNYKYTYTGTGTNTWKSINFPVFSFTPGKKYDYSCKVRCNACTSNVVFELRASRMNNDWTRPKSTTVCSSSLADGKWHEYHLIITLEETSDRSGTTCKTAPLIEFYTGAMTTKDAVFSFDFDLKDVQVTECDVNTPISNGAWNDGIVYDVSGYGNHGSAKSDYISYNNDSPRYDGSYKLLNGKQVYVYIPNFAFENMSKGTVNIWINRHSTDDVWRTYLYFANSYNWVGQALDFIIIGSTGSQSITMDCCSNCSTREPALNTWNMYTITWDLETHTSKHYFNGNLINTITNDRIDTEYASKHNGHFIGNIYTKDNSSTSDYSLSDFRLYATTLSDQDIKQLYDTPVSLTNNGTLMTQGEFIEK